MVAYSLSSRRCPRPWSVLWPWCVLGWLITRPLDENLCPVSVLGASREAGKEDESTAFPLSSSSLMIRPFSVSLLRVLSISWFSFHIGLVFTGTRASLSSNNSLAFCKHYVLFPLGLVGPWSAGRTVVAGSFSRLRRAALLSASGGFCLTASGWTSIVHLWGLWVFCGRRLTSLVGSGASLLGVELQQFGLEFGFCIYGLILETQP